MECGKVRDQFSSLLEGELNPSEEKVIREHLDSCSECQRELEQFDKTIRWVHSVEEVEVPDGFLSGIYEKMENRKREALLREKAGWRWFSYPRSMKLPIQAVAMVVIVFLALYLTKIMPVERPLPKEVERAKAPYSETHQPLLETPRPPSPKVEPLASEASPPPPLAAKPPQEIVLRISDQDKVLSQLHELIRQFGGEIERVEGNVILTSLPRTSFSEFERELKGLSSSPKAYKMAPQKDEREGLGVSAGVQRRFIGKKGEEPEEPVITREEQIPVRIILLQE